ncbi:nucleoid occlusion protein [Clostridia bacterium]|nr:nucleoid occlusion protein [Clostridia bacterium]
MNNEIREIRLDQLVPFANHPFKLYSETRLDEMAKSIVNGGVHVPIIVRPKDGKYEILSGHNRSEAAKLAGLETVPAIVRDELTDDEALLVVTETNLHQRSFADLSHSERALALTMHMNAIRKQGKRNDLINEVNDLLGTNSETEQTSCLIDNKLKAHEKSAIEFGLSPKTVSRYLRVDKLIEPLKERLDSDELGLYAAVSLSYLSDDEQLDLEIFIEDNPTVKIDIRKAEALREAARENALATDDFARIILGYVDADGSSDGKIAAVRLGTKMLKEYFKNGESAKEIENTIRAALKLYQENLSGSNS